MMQTTELNPLDVLYFEMSKPYYIIKDLELDVEFDYVPREEKEQAIAELEQYIQDNSISQQTGECEIRPEDIIYIPSTGEIEYAETYFEYMQRGLNL